jgi:hypothetical protein
VDRPEDFQIGTLVLIGNSTEVHIVSCKPFLYGGSVCVYLKDKRKHRFRGGYNIDQLKIIQEEKHHGQ